MKYLILSLLLCCSSVLKAQTLREAEDQLIRAYDKLEDYAEHASDGLTEANRSFKQQLRCVKIRQVLNIALSD